ncbi:MAG TPA: GNAT family N-acetyltransferase [Clostridiaceae bacterium]|nr:GNAT family N-acetyltransferase [Clostridiaceae bacterium]
MNGFILLNNKQFAVRLLNSADENLVQDLCERCSDYYLLAEGRLPDKKAGHGILSDLPPGKESSDKFVYGVFNPDNVLVAVADIVRNYREEGEWMLGLLLIDPNERGSGLGRIIHEYIKNMVREQGGVKIRIGVLEDNIRAVKFWTGLGYSEVGRVRLTYGDKEHDVIIMNLVL